jgi:hypothetical protein
MAMNDLLSAARTVLMLTKYDGQPCQDCDPEVNYQCEQCALESTSRQLANHILSTGAGYTLAMKDAVKIARGRAAECQKNAEHCKGRATRPAAEIWAGRAVEANDIAELLEAATPSTEGDTT